MVMRVAVAFERELDAIAHDAVRLPELEIVQHRVRAIARHDRVCA